MDKMVDRIDWMMVMTMMMPKVLHQFDRIKKKARDQLWLMDAFSKTRMGHISMMTMASQMPGMINISMAKISAKPLMIFSPISLPKFCRKPFQTSVWLNCPLPFWRYWFMYSRVMPKIKMYEIRLANISHGIHTNISLLLLTPWLTMLESTLLRLPYM